MQIFKKMDITENTKLYKYTIPILLFYSKLDAYMKKYLIGNYFRDDNIVYLEMESDLILLKLRFR